MIKPFAGHFLPIASFVCLGTALPACASEKAPNYFAIAVGGLVTPDYEGSDDFVFSPAGGAILRVEGIKLTLRGNGASLDLVPQHKDQTFKINVGPYVDLNFDRSAIPHDPVVALTRKRKVALEGGGFIGFTKTGVLTSKYDSLSVKITAVHDLGNVHHSFVITPAVEYLMPVSHKVLLGASLSADVVGGRYARHYFGVGPINSTLSGLPEYRPGAGVKSASLSLLSAIALNGNLDKRGPVIGASVTYERLLGSFAQSPIVALRGNPNQISAVAGVGYQF